MTWVAFILILASVLMHSMWHFLCKSSGKSSMAFFALFSTSLFLTMLPFALFSGVLGQLPWRVLGFALLGSVFAGMGDLGLMLAYKYSDISLAYPLARALPVFLTMLFTAVFGWGKSLSIAAQLGMMIIFAGCLMMAFSNHSGRLSWQEKMQYIRKGLVGIILAALATTFYTIVDSFGIRSIIAEFPEQNKLLLSGTYSCCREFPVMITMWAAAGVRAYQKRDQGLLSSLSKMWHPYAAGVCAALAYVLILLSMNYVNNVSFVQSFRQLSLPVSALLGAVILHEKCSLLRWSALLVIMLGLIMSVY
ncbi:MAG: hypothetical protein E7052_02340 [Lentisphaerae bacterium]|nr:hypothetical protein [Lentisphaerota bacterium]